MIDTKKAKYAKQLVAQAKQVYADAKEDDALSLSVFKKTKVRIKILSNGKRAGITYASLNRVIKSGDGRKLDAYIKTLEHLIESPQATRQGREEITKRAKETYLRNRENIDSATVNMIYDVFASDIYHMLLEKGLISSDTVRKIVDLTIENDKIGEKDEMLSFFLETYKKVSKNKTLKIMTDSDEKEDFIYETAKKLFLEYIKKF